MSLLLDALKKAADDKQKASQDKRADSELSSDNAETSNTDELTLQAADNSSTPAELSIDELKESEALSLEAKVPAEQAGDQAPEEQEPDEQEPAAELTLDALPEQSNEATTVNALENESQAIAQEQKLKNNGSAAAGFTVSDDALSMLIKKTNRDVKRGSRIIYFSVFMLSLAVLAAGGVYYYLDTQAEIENLERKHRIAMQSMRSKTSGQANPEKSEIVRNLVSDATLNEKVENVKQQQPKAAVKERAPVARARKKARNTVAVESTKDAVVSIQKSKQSDPVGEKLDAAWLAYEDGQYNKAKTLYADVLSVESNNRDALLGLGAIAVLEKNNAGARSMYLKLLELDPRDPIASAALASLHSDAVSLKSDEETLLGLLQKNPKAAHLNFALANTYAQQDKWKRAQQYYFDAWKYDPENADYIFNLAVSMDQLGKQQQAINFYQDSLNKAANKQVSFSRQAVQQRINELSEL